MTRVLLIAALVAVAFWVYAIVDCALQPPTRHRGVTKPTWLIIIVLLPVLGGLLWFVVGRGRRRGGARPIAPDDDPAFLGSIGAISDQDERIRRLEEELAQLDSEDDAAPGGGATRASSDDDDDPRGSRGAS